MIYLLENLAAFLGAALVVALTGRLIERHALGRLRLPAEDSWRPLARWVLGLAFWVAAGFAAGSLGLLGRGCLWLIVALVLVGALAGRRMPPVRGWIRRPAPAPRMHLAGIAVLAALLLPVFLLANTPTVSWDASAYHLTVPRLWNEHGGFRPVELNVYSAWPLATELLFAWAMLARSFVLAKLVHFGFGLLTLFAVAAGCRQLGGQEATGRTFDPWSWVAMTLFAANSVVLFEMRTAYVDLAYAFFVTATFLFLDRALGAADAERPACLLLAGVAGGLAAGIKVTGILGVAVVSALWLPRLVRALRDRRPRELSLFLRCFGLPAAALWLPWLVRSAWLTGDPFYPFLYRWLGGPDWSLDLGRRLAVWQQGIGMGREPLDYLLLPLRVILDGGPGYGHFDGRLGACWLAFVPLALVFGRRPGCRRALAIAGLYFALWALTSQQMRFLIPVLPLLAIVAAVALRDLADRLSSQRLRGAALGLALLAPWLWSTAAERGVLSRGYRLFTIPAAAWGREAVPPVFREIDRRLPEDARVLFLGTNQGFFCSREYLADSFFEASQIAEWLRPAATPDELRRRLDERRITHLLVDRAGFPRVGYPDQVAALLGDPSRVELLIRDEPRFEVYRLLPAPDR